MWLFWLLGTSQRIAQETSISMIGILFEPGAGESPGPCIQKLILPFASEDYGGEKQGQIFEVSPSMLEPFEECFDDLNGAS